MKLSVIVPCYNEEKTVAALLKKVESVSVSKEVIVIDDGSTDNTREILKGFQYPPFKIILKSANSGKGDSIREGLRHAQGDIIIIQDADLEYDPQDYIRLILPITDGKADVVYGSRWAGVPFSRQPFNIFRVGTWFLTWLTNMLYNAGITDEPTCYKVFKSGVLKGIELKCRRFEFCPEVTAKLRKKGYRIYEVPIHYEPRTVRQGKKVNWKDGIEAVWTLLKYRFHE